MPMPRKYDSAAQRQASYRARRRARGESPAGSAANGSVYRRWHAMHRQALGLLEQVLREMQDYHDQRSESWQDSERGESFVEVMESLAETVETLKDIT